jgi:hypothetical protein
MWLFVASLSAREARIDSISSFMVEELVSSHLLWGSGWIRVIIHSKTEDKTFPKMGEISPALSLEFNQNPFLISSLPSHCIYRL